MQFGPSQLLSINLAVFLNNYNAKFHVVELGFFNFYFNNKLTETKADIKYMSIDTYL